MPIRISSLYRRENDGPTLLLHHGPYTRARARLKGEAQAGEQAQVA
jgi:hypothetical protein